MLRDSGNNPVGTPTDKVSAGDTLIYCDACKTFLAFWPLYPEEVPELKKLCFPIVYSDHTGNYNYLHVCLTCMNKEDREPAVEALQAYVVSLIGPYDEAAEQIRVQFNLRGEELKAKSLQCDELSINLEQAKQKLQEAERRVLVSEAANKRVHAALQALELKLGKMNSDNFAAVYREPIFVVLIQEGEDIIRRFMAGPTSQEDTDRFTEKIRKWLSSGKKAIESTQTAKVTQAQDALKAGLNIKPPKAETPKE